MRGIFRVSIFLSLFCIAVFSSGSIEAAETSVSIVKAGADSKALGAALGILEDKSGQLTIEDVSNAAIGHEFVYARGTKEAGPVHFGFSRSALWGRFTLVNPTSETVEQIIEFGSPVVDRLEFYRPADDRGEFRRQVTGDSVVGRSVDIPGVNFLYRVKLQPQSSATYYVRISGDSLITFDVKVHDPDRYFDKISANFDPVILFFGLILAGAFYSLAIFAVVRDSAYLLFSLLIIGVACYFASLWGYINAFVLPETTWASNFVISASTCLVLFSLARFSRIFLEFENKYPKFDLVCRIFEGLSAVLLLISIVNFQFMHLSIAFLSFASFGLSLMLAIKLWRSGQVYGRFFSLSWIYFCGISAILPFDRAGLLPWSDVLRSGYQISFVFVCMTFAILFAEKYRISVDKKEGELRAARDEAIAASQAKSHFLAMMSHELRTPLNAVIGFSDILRMETMGALGHPRYKEYAQDIKDSGSHLLAIINDLLEISRIEAGQVELDEGPIGITALVRRCLRIIDERAKENNLVLESVVADSLPALYGDETRIQQVLINLLYNAVKFTPAGGRIRLEVSLIAGEGILFSISDTGIGIAEVDRARILEPFTQVDSHLTRRHDGAGLGLAIAKSILDLHDARLEISGAIGQGTTFSIHFPWSRVERPQA